MKIYCVTTGTGSNHVHTNYQSACQSLAYWNRPGNTATLTAAWIPSDAWRPVDAATERRLAKVQRLWDELIETDQAALDALLESLVAKQGVQVKEPALASGGFVKGPLLTDTERTEAMLRLNRLVDAG